MQIGEQVDFELQDQNGTAVKLSQFRGSPVVLFFYPRADTPGCTVEACSFRDSYERLEAAGAIVLGISRDTAKAQKKFEEKYDLNYPLLADPDEIVCNQFGVLKPKNMYGKLVKGIERTTFVIGPAGSDGKQHVAHIFEKVNPDGHAGEVFDWLQGSGLLSRGK